MERSVASLLSLYRPENPIEKAFTIPSPWYFDERLARLEAERVFCGAPGRWWPGGSGARERAIFYNAAWR